jgi:hypothetical protein
MARIRAHPVGYPIKPRLTLPEMPDGTSGQVLTAQGAGVDPTYGRLGPSGLEWTAGKLLKGAGPGADPTEVDPAPQSLYDHGGLYWHTLFESLDGFLSGTVGTGVVDLDDISLGLVTGTTVDSKAYVRKYPNYPVNTLTWEKNRRFKTKIRVAALAGATGDVSWLVTGYVDAYAHIGFKIDGTTLYGTVADGTAESTLNIQTVAAGDNLVLEAVLTAGSQVEFFVDGLSKGTLSTNIPSGTAYAAFILYLYVYNDTTAANQGINVSEWRFLQEE